MTDPSRGIQSTEPIVSNEMKSSLFWKKHFKRTRDGDSSITWEIGASLTDDERKAIVASVQEFQMGERSEGKNLMRFAIQHAISSGDTEYPKALRYFIYEENRHASDLQRFLEAIGEKTIRKSWINRIFSKTRRLAGLELSISILVTAEVVATVYYAALAAATDSILLKSLCRKILRDEDWHIQFQFQRLGLLRWNRSKVQNRFAKTLHGVLLFLTLIAIWPKHGRVFRRGGMGFRRLVSETFCELHVGFEWMDRNSYRKGSLHNSLPSTRDRCHLRPETRG